MLIVYNCIVNEHDLRLVGLAAAICASASFAAITLLHHVRASVGQMKYFWLSVSATTTGFGIWATHFIAMLAYAPSVLSGYNLFLTLLSLVAAVILTSAGLAVSLARKFSTAALGGAIVGGGIAMMHYMGMAAFEVAGRLLWDPVLIGASVALGIVLGALALRVGLHGDKLQWKALGALLLTAAICSHHFTAMGAVSILPDPSIEVSASALPSYLLAIIVALTSFAIIALAIGGLVLDLDRRQKKAESDHMRGLANAAVEGLIVCDRDTIVTVNNSFAALVGCDADAAVGTNLASYFPAVQQGEFRQPNTSIETELRSTAGIGIPVELIMRPIEFIGKSHQAIAIRDLRSRKLIERHIHFLAHHDTLTGLANRNSFNHKLDQEIEAALIAGNSLGVLFLDLDRFKEVNDLFGHAAGDALLQLVAKSVSGILDDNQMMARLGGDEFAIILPAISGADIATQIAEQVLEVLRVESAASLSASIVSASIGIALCPDDGLDRQTLLSHADTALYRAKFEGRSKYLLFKPAMGMELRDRRMIEYELRQALAGEQLSLAYQPQQDVKTSKIKGFEALLRWTHSERGNMAPGQFIPIAEESGLILELGEWVLREACREAASWTRQLSIAVNVSTVQLHNANFVPLVHEILLQTGLSPSRLELEITETALVGDINRALVTLRQLKTLGVQIAMDDFGTGYSSLYNLRAFPFDKIKIDRSFVKSVDANEQAATIVRAVLGLAHGLGLPVLAEGVETAEELEFLSKEHCDEVQGYLLGRPAEISSFRSLTHVELQIQQPAFRRSGAQRFSS